MIAIVVGIELVLFQQQAGHARKIEHSSEHCEDRK
jgi:hypothetical protein